MKAKLTVNGKEFEVDISEEQAEALMENKKTGFERTSRGNMYFTICVERGWCTETNEKYDNDVYLNGRYFNDRCLREDYIRAINLFLKLSQWQALNDKPITRGAWFEITNKYKKVEPTCANTYRFGIIRFSSYEKAKEAIEVFYSDLEWYFKEFKPRLDM